MLEDFLLYPSRRTKYSSVVTNGNGTVHDANTFDVTSIQERLEEKKS